MHPRLKSGYVSNLELLAGRDSIEPTNFVAPQWRQMLLNKERPADKAPLD